MARPSDDDSAPDHQPQWARALLGLMAGDAGPLSMLRAQLAGGHEEEEGDMGTSASRAVAGAHAITFGRRVALARAEDQNPVALTDGAPLAADKAARLLADKEQEDAHPVLRALVDQSFHIRQFHDLRNEWLRALPARGAVPDDVAQDARAHTVFLRETSGARDAARELLAHAGNIDLDTPARLARALNLPDAHGAFSHDVSTALLRAVLEAARGAAELRPLKKTRAPRLLAGLVVDDGEAVRMLDAPSLRAARHLDLLVGGAAGVLHALRLGVFVDAGWPQAIAIAAAGAGLRKKLGFERRQCERAERVVAALSLLRARVAAAAYVTRVAHPDDHDAEREGLHKALGGDLGDVDVERATPWPWPVDSPLRDDLEQRRAVASAHGRVGLLWAMALEAHDDDFAVRRGFFSELAAGALHTTAPPRGVGDDDENARLADARARAAAFMTLLARVS